MPQTVPAAISLQYNLTYHVLCVRPNRNELTVTPQKNTVFTATFIDMKETNCL